MPELPEMENYKQLLNQKIKGHVITNVEINREKSINVTTNMFYNLVINQTVIKVERRGKHLLIYLENKYILLLHLMLGGWTYYGTVQDKPERSFQIRLAFGSHYLYFIGLRLGYLHLYTATEVEEALADLGPEPLDRSFTRDKFLRMTEHKRGKLKTALIDQHFLSGIGNRYSDEICWHAKLLPTTSWNEIKHHDKLTLYESIRLVLQQAIQHGGYMNNQLFKEDNQTGGYAKFFNVYNREGKQCNRCENQITKQKVSSRKTFYCTGCQK